MIFPKNTLLLALCVAAALPLPAIAQQPAPAPSPAPAPAPAPLEGFLCDAFTKNNAGDWIAKRGVIVPGPGGMVEIKAGTPADDDLQERLDVQCR